MFRWILKKKSLHWVVLLALLVGIFPAPANVGAATGDNTGVFTPQSVTGPAVSLEASKTLVRPGEEFEVYLTVSDAAYLVGGSLDLAFDPSVASFTGLWAGSLFGNVTDAVYEDVYGDLPYTNSDWVFEMAAPASVGDTVYGNLGEVGQTIDLISVTNNVYNSQGAAVISYGAVVSADTANNIYPYANADTDSNLVTLTFTANSEGVFPLGLLPNTTGVGPDSLSASSTTGNAMAKFSQEIPPASGATSTQQPLNFTIKSSAPVEVVDASAFGYVFVNDGLEGDAPIAGAKVEVLQPGTENVVATVYTDSTGRYLLPAALTVTEEVYADIIPYDLRFSKEGFKAQSVIEENILVNYLTEINEVRLPADRSITGIVKDRNTSQPLSGVTVAVYVYDRQEPVAATTTGTDGHYLLGPLNSDTEYTLSFSAVGYNYNVEYVHLHLPAGTEPWLDIDPVYMHDNSPYFDYFEPSWAIEGTSVPVAVYGGNFGTSTSSVTVSVYRISPWEETEHYGYGQHPIPVYAGQMNVTSVSDSKIEGTISSLNRGWYRLLININGETLDTRYEEIMVRPAGIGLLPWSRPDMQVLSPGYPQTYYNLDDWLYLYNTAGNETFQLRLSPGDSDDLISTSVVPSVYVDLISYDPYWAETEVEYTLPVGIPKGTYQKWLVVNPGTETEEKVFIGYLVVGEPVIDWISPQPIPATPGAEIYVTGLFLGNESSTTFHVYNTNGDLITSIAPERSWGPYGTYPDPVESNFDLKLPQMNIAPGDYNIVAQVYDERSLPYRVRIENGHFLINWTKQPPVFKAGVESFTIFIGGYSLEGTTYTARLLPWGEYDEQEAVAVGTSTHAGTDMGREFIQLDFQAEDPISAGEYIIQVVAADNSPVYYADAWAGGIDVEFVDEPIVYEVRPDFIEPQRADQEIKVLGWNLGDETYKVSVTQNVYNGVTHAVYATPVTGQVYGTNFNIEYLPVTLPPLQPGAYYVTITSATYGDTVPQWGDDNLWLYVDHVSSGVNFPFEPWGASVVTREVYHEGDVYYADAFDISNIATWGIDWNNNTASAELWRWDGKPAVLGENPIQTVTADVYGPDASGHLTVKVPAGLWAGGYTVDLSIGDMKWSGAFTVGNADGHAMVTNTWPVYVNAGTGEIHGGMQGFGLADLTGLKVTLVDAVYGNEVATSDMSGYGVNPSADGRELWIKLKVTTTGGLPAGTYKYQLWAGDALQDIRWGGEVEATTEPFLWGGLDPWALQAGASSYSLKFDAANLDDISNTELEAITVKLYDRNDNDRLVATETTIEKSITPNGRQYLIANFANQPLPNEHTSLMVEVANIKNSGFGEIQVVNEPWITGANWGQTRGVDLEVYGYYLGQFSVGNLTVTLADQYDNSKLYQATVTGVVYGVIKATVDNLPNSDYNIIVMNNGTEVPGGAVIGFYGPSSGVNFPFEPWGASVVTREVYHEGDVYYADAFDISNITTWGVDWNNNTASAKLWRWDGKPAVLGENPIQTVTADVYGPDASGHLTVKVPAGLWAGGYTVDLNIGDMKRSGAFTVGNAEGHAVVTKTWPAYVNAGTGEIHGGMQGFGLAGLTGLKVKLVDAVYGNEVATSDVSGYGVNPGNNGRELWARLKVTTTTGGLPEGIYKYQLWAGDVQQDIRWGGEVEATYEPFLWGGIDPWALQAGASTYSLKFDAANLDDISVTELDAISVKLYDRNDNNRLVATETTIEKSINPNGHQYLIANFTNQPLPNEPTSLMVEVTNIKSSGFGDIQVADEPWITGAGWGARPGVDLQVFGHWLNELNAANLSVNLLSQNSTSSYQATDVFVENGVIKATVSNLLQGDYQVEVKHNGKMLPGGTFIGFYLPPAPPEPLQVILPEVQEANGINTAPAFDVAVIARGTDWSKVAAEDYGVVLWNMGNSINPISVTKDVYDQDKFIARFAGGLAAGRYWLVAYVQGRPQGMDFWINSAYPIMTNFSPWAVAAGREYFHLRLGGLRLDEIQNPVVQVVNGATVVATSSVVGDPKVGIRFRDEHTLEADLKTGVPSSFIEGQYDIILLDGNTPVEKRFTRKLAVKNTAFLYPQVQPQDVPTSGPFTLILGGELLHLLDPANLTAKLISDGGQPVAMADSITIQSVPGVRPEMRLTFAGGLPAGDYGVQVLEGVNVIPGTESTVVHATGMPTIYSTDYFWGYNRDNDTSYPLISVGTYNLSQWGATVDNLKVKIHHPDGTSTIANVFKYQNGNIIARLPNRLLPGGYGVEVYVTEQNKVHGQLNVPNVSGDITAPVVSFIAPAAGTTVTDNPPLIKFQSSDEGGAGIYEHTLWLDDVRMLREDFELLSVDHNGVITIRPKTAIAAGQYTLTIVAMDRNGNFGKAEVTFTVAAPTQGITLNITQPASDHITVNTQSYTVQGTVSDPTASVYVQVNPVGEPTEADWATVDTNGMFTKEVNLAEGLNEIKVTATKATVTATPVTRSITRSVTTADTTPPTISNFAPTGNIAQVRPTISFSMSDNLGGTGVNLDSLQVRLDNNPVSGTVVNNQFSYTPTEDLESITHTVSASVYDNAGNNTTDQWSFTIQPVVTGTAVQVKPLKTSTGLNGTVDVEIWINNVSNLVGTDVFINFDAQRLRVVDAYPDEENPGIQALANGIFPVGTTTSFVAQNTADNNTGLVSFSATKLGTPPASFSGNGRVFTIKFEAISEGNAFINVSTAGTSSTNLANSSNQPINYSTENTSVSVVSGSMVYGVAQLIGRSNHSGIDAQLRNTAYSTETNSDGIFQIVGVPDGNYTLELIKPAFLKKTVSVEVVGGDVEVSSSETPLEMKFGDLVADGIINIFDLVSMALSYGKNSSMSDWNSVQLNDANVDDKINIFDLVAMALNYGARE